ncbi:MAG: hypothetical protein EBZ77_11725 [Chitinophagia bacterium]|nr:hypothetical protein [Chitinophagia bacterium]
MAAIGCKKNGDVSTSATGNAQLLRDSIVHIQGKIKTESDNISLKMQGATVTYKQADVQLSVANFKQLRTQQKKAISSLAEVDRDTLSVVEMVICGDFEDPSCFISNWDVIKVYPGVGLSFDTTESYNHSTSLHLIAPFDATRHNQHGIGMGSYVNGIVAGTVYEIKFWAKFSGPTTTDGSPTTYVYVYQDGEYLNEGRTAIDNGATYNEDWRLYSFTITAVTGNPLSIHIASCIADCWIDDLHIVRR